MKKGIMLLLLGMSSVFSFGQNRQDAEKAVNEGVALHDKEDFNGAIAMYNKALALDKDNAMALTEKGLSLMYLEKYEEAIAACQRAVEKHPDDSAITSAYITWGNALDALRQNDKAIKVYDEGIKRHPGYFMLYYNRGVSLAGQEKYDLSLRDFKTAVLLNPRHASSHNAIARLMESQGEKVPALLAYCRFMVLELQGQRAQENLEAIRSLIKGNAKKTAGNTITISLAADATKDAKKEDDFRPVELVMGLASAVDLTGKDEGQSDVELFASKCEMVFSSLKKEEADKGFFWTYYAPYFAEMAAQKQVSVFANMAFASSDNPAVTAWLKTHKADIDKFYQWSGSFKWAKNAGG